MSGSSGMEPLDRRFRLRRSGVIGALVCGLVFLVACTGSQHRRTADDINTGEPGVSEDPMVFCANAVPVSYSEFIEISALDALEDPQAGQWRSALEDLPDQPLLFGDHYRLLTADEDVVTLATTEGGQIGSVSLWRQGERWVTFSTPSVRDCEVRIPLDDGHSYTDVYRDPAWKPAPSDNSIELVAYEPVCEPEREPPDNFKTSLVETAAAVTVNIFWVRPEDATRCRGRQATPLTVALAAPLNGRRLLDGTHVPPRRIYRPGIELTGSATPSERRSRLAGTPNHEGSPAETGDPSRVYTMIDE